MTADMVPPSPPGSSAPESAPLAPAPMPPPPRQTVTAALEVDHVSRWYGNVVAVNDISFGLGAGVTLTEVLVAIAILAVIIVPLGNALIAFLKNNDETMRRLSENQDVQLAAAYFAQDVQNIGVRNWTLPGYPLQPSVEQPGPAGSGSTSTTAASPACTRGASGASTASSAASPSSARWPTRRWNKSATG